MAQPGTRRHQKERKELAKNRNPGRKKRLETFCPLTHIKQKWRRRRRGSTGGGGAGRGED
jgi:hypothetical protein